VSLKCAAVTKSVIGAFYDVYNELGYGFLDEESLVVELRASGMTVERQVPIPVWFRGVNVGNFRADLLVNHVALVELKACRTLESAHEAQLLHYLKATETEVGVLLYFGQRPQFRRPLFDNARKKIRANPCEFVAEVLA